MRDYKFTLAASIWFVISLYAFFRPRLNLKLPQSTFYTLVVDKIIHFVLFAVLTYLVVRASSEHNNAWKNQHIITLLTSYALLTEVVQHFTAHRNGDIYDFIADVAGILFVIFFFKKVKN